MFFVLDTLLDKHICEMIMTDCFLTQCWMKMPQTMSAIKSALIKSSNQHHCQRNQLHDQGHQIAQMKAERLFVCLLEF